MTQEWIFIIQDSLEKLLRGFVDFVPRLLGALIIFIIGWIIAIAIEQVVTRILIQLKFNRLFEKAGWKEALEKAEFKVNPAEFIGVIFKWILVIVFLLIAIQILGFQEFADILARVVNWLPNLVVAVAMFVVAAIAADILGKLTVVSLEKTKVGRSDLAGKIVRWLVWILAVFAILLQLKIAVPLIDTLFTFLMGALAIAFGLAFGLGGKDLAADLLRGFKQRIQK